MSESLSTIADEGLPSNFNTALVMVPTQTNQSLLMADITECVRCSYSLSSGNSVVMHTPENWYLAIRRDVPSA